MNDRREFLKLLGILALSPQFLRAEEPGAEPTPEPPSEHESSSEPTPEPPSEHESSSEPTPEHSSEPEAPAHAEATPAPEHHADPEPSPAPEKAGSDRGYVICEPCIGTKDAACADVCPVDCIYGKNERDFDQLFINPEECIECGLCENACPVRAIYMNAEVPDKWKSYIRKNARHFGL